MVGVFRELEGKTLLVCVGAMRSATSWIWYYLSSIPGVEVSPVKELHYFNAKFPANSLSDMDMLSVKRLSLHAGRDGHPVDNLLYTPVFRASVDRVQMIYDDDAYFGHFARLCTPETTTLCDVTPAYAAIGQPGFAYMKDFIAAHGLRLKLLFVMRDPVDRLWSQLCHMAQLNPEVEFATRWSEAIRSTPIMARADYRATVRDMDTTFETEDCLYLFYEHLFIEATLSQLCRFIGLGDYPADTEGRANAAVDDHDLPEDARVAFLEALAPQYDFCHDRFGDQVPAGWSA